MQAHALKLLAEVWGYSGFRTGQWEIIHSVLTRPATLAILPTGGGKSLTYQVPGLMLSGLTIVISPLLSLIADQVDGLVKRGIQARSWSSALRGAEKEQLLNDIHAHRVKFLYLAPESLRNKQLLSLLINADVSLVAVDEAHCISLWGHDFRPAYLEIKDFLTLLKNSGRKPKVTAVTATATQQTIADIKKQLGHKDIQVHKGSFRRDNIAVNVLQAPSQGEFVNLIKQRSEFGIVLCYVSTRKRALELSELLNVNGIQSNYYHAGLDNKTRGEVFVRFQSDQLQVLVATNAFGMGVDKPNVYSVFHDRVPDSIENYYQEIGRAGRDGKEAQAYLNLNWAGINQRRQMLDNRFPRKALYEAFYNYLRAGAQGKGTVSLSEEKAVTELAGINSAKYAQLVARFTAAGVISVADRSGCVELLRPNVIFLGRYINFRSLEHQRKSAADKFVAMLKFTQAEGCRMGAILNYFSEVGSACGHCDNCRFLL